MGLPMLGRDSAAVKRAERVVQQHSKRIGERPTWSRACGVRPAVTMQLLQPQTHMVGCHQVSKAYHMSRALQALSQADDHTLEHVPATCSALRLYSAC